MQASQSVPRFFVLVPCAGAGSRAGGGEPKQYRPIAGRPMVAHTIDAFRALAGRFAGLALVVSADDDRVAAALPGFPGADEHLWRVGGASRAETVANGLAALREAGARVDDWVLVHDAARCLVTPEQIGALVDACSGDAVGGLLAHRLPDTLKVASPDGRAARTLSRDDKWLAQTPQMFRIGLLGEALRTAMQMAVDTVTDEASAVEMAGLSPLLVPGNALNFKITYPEDFELAEAVLRARRDRPETPASS